MNQEKKQMNCKPACIRYRGSISGKRGFSLLELVIAIFILVVGIMSALGLIVSTVRTSMDTRNAVIASGLAQEGVELVRNIRDNNMLLSLSDLSRDSGEDFSAGLPDVDGRGCRFDYANSYACTVPTSNDEARLYLDPDNFYTHASTDNKATPFRRVVYFYYDYDTGGNLAGVKITSRVWWGDSLGSSCDMANRCIEVGDYLSKRD